VVLQQISSSLLPAPAPAPASTPAPASAPEPTPSDESTAGGEKEAMKKADERTEEEIYGYDPYAGTVY
jgi:hypothetical protein